MKKALTLLLLLSHLFVHAMEIKQLVLQPNMISEQAKRKLNKHITTVTHKGNCCNLRRYIPLPGVFTAYQQLNTAGIEKIITDQKTLIVASKLIHTVMNSFVVRICFLVAHESEKSIHTTKESSDSKWKLFISNLKIEMAEQLYELFEESLHSSAYNGNCSIVQFLKRNQNFDSQKYGYQLSGYLFANSLLYTLESNHHLRNELYNNLKDLPSITELREIWNKVKKDK